MRHLVPHTSVLTSGIFEGRERFMRFHGERYAQLDSDRSVYANSYQERSLLFNILTWMFLFTPPIYFEQLNRIWVDKKINYDRWRSFIGDLQDDWVAAITPVSLFRVIMVYKADLAGWV